MTENPYRVGKTQWAKWNEAGREAYNRVRSQGMLHVTGVAEADAVTAKTEKERKDKKLGLFGRITKAANKVSDVADKVSDVAEAVVPAVAVVKTVVRATRKKKAK
jgi:hypothetical protein